MTDSGSQQRMIFINLPVADLERAKAFYAAIGATNEPKFTNDKAAAMILGEGITVMLLTYEFYQSFTGKQIADAHKTSQVLLCISCASKAEVDSMVDSAAGAGGRADPGPRQEVADMMYGRSFEDPDGHHWEPMWMSPAASATGSQALETV